MQNGQGIYDGCAQYETHSISVELNNNSEVSQVSEDNNKFTEQLKVSTMVLSLINGNGLHEQNIPKAIKIINIAFAEQVKHLVDNNSEAGDNLETVTIEKEVA